MGGTSLQMWKLSKRITIGEPIPQESHANVHSNPVSKINWECIWKHATATEVHFLSFSPDSYLFATAGKFDRLVKIWYPCSSKLEYQDCVVKYQCSIRIFVQLFVLISAYLEVSVGPGQVMYDFLYLAHPRAVTGFSWRQTSKYMPK